MPGVTVVVPNWNRRDLIDRLLDRLGNQTHPIQDIVIVDNGSNDGSVELARSKGARVIALERNMGFAAAVNRGIREAQTEWIAIVNNDVDPAPDWLSHLAAAVSQPRVWFATGKLHSALRPGRLDGAFNLISRGACPWQAGSGCDDGPLWNEPRRIRFAPLTAGLFRAELFRKVGLLEERFGSYLEDVDFGLRCAIRGCYGVYAPGASAAHIGSATLGAWSSETVRLIARNQVLLLARHYPARYLVRYAWPIFVAQLLWGFLAVKHRRGLAWVRGKLQGAALFWTARRDAAREGLGPRGLSKMIEHSEAEIYRLQKRCGFDAYWRLYFRLT